MSVLTVESMALAKFFTFSGFSMLTVIPVSYTHLDVYKRQVLMRPALVHSLNCTYFLRQRKIDLIDVYKRQEVPLDGECMEQVCLRCGSSPKWI